MYIYLDVGKRRGVQMTQGTFEPPPQSLKVFSSRCSPPRMKQSGRTTCKDGVSFVLRLMHSTKAVCWTRVDKPKLFSL